MALTPKQKAFCEEYVKDFNATAAYQRAGYSASADIARREGYRLMTKPDIQAYIQELQEQRSQRTQISADQVLTEIARIAFSKITDVVTFDSHGVYPKESETLDEKFVSAIAQVDISISEKGVRRSVKMHDKIKALGMLMQHLGMTGDFNNAIATFRRYGLIVHQVDEKWVINEETDTATD